MLSLVLCPAEHFCASVWRWKNISEVLEKNGCGKGYMYYITTHSNLCFAHDFVKCLTAISTV